MKAIELIQEQALDNYTAAHEELTERVEWFFRKIDAIKENNGLPIDQKASRLISELHGSLVPEICELYGRVQAFSRQKDLADWLVLDEKRGKYDAD